MGSDMRMKFRGKGVDWWSRSCRHSKTEGWNKRVESVWFPCLDEGSLHSKASLRAERDSLQLHNLSKCKPLTFKKLAASLCPTSPVFQFLGTLSGILQWLKRTLLYSFYFLCLYVFTWIYRFWFVAICHKWVQKRVWKLQNPFRSFKFPDLLP